MSSSVPEVSRPPGFAAQGVLSIGAAFGRMADAIRDMSAADRKMRLASELYQTPVAPMQIPISGTAGVLQATDQLGPMTGQYWSVRRLVAYGYSAGTVTVYRNALVTGTGSSAAAVGEQVVTFPQSGTYTFGRGEFLMRPDDFMVLVATGVTLATGQTGITIYGDADCFSSWLLPDYIM